MPTVLHVPHTGNLIQPNISSKAGPAISVPLLTDVYPTCLQSPPSIVFTALPKKTILALYYEISAFNS